MRTRIPQIVLALLLPATAALCAPAAPAPSIPISGRATGPGGAPLVEGRALLIPVVSRFEAVRLELEGKADPEPAATATLAADGSFRLNAPAAGMWKVMVQGRGCVPQQMFLLPLTDETELATVSLDKDVRLEVRVNGPDGKALAGARVRASDTSFSMRRFRRGGWAAPDRSGVTDEKGVAVLPREADETLTVRAGVSGLVFTERRDVRVSGVALKLEAGRPRDVRVSTAAGKPLGGVLVKVGEAEWVAGRTSPEGLLTVPVPASGRIKAEALAEDGASVDGVVVVPSEPTDPAGKPAVGPYELRLPARLEVAGRVVSRADGRPVAGALVWGDDAGLVQRAGKDGSYKLTITPGDRLPVQAAAQGFFGDQATWLAVPGERRAPTLALEPAFAVAGVVVDEQGRPVAGAEVRADPDFRSRMRSSFTFTSGGTARTSAAGRFRLPTLAAGVGHQLRLSKPGYAPATADLPPVDPVRPAADLRLVLLRGRMAFGRVVDGAGQGVAGAQVTLELVGSGDRMRMMMRRMQQKEDEDLYEAATDGTGRFEVRDLPQGTFDLVARGAGFAPLTVPGLAVPEGAGSTDLGTIALAPGVALEGLVTDSGGRPVEGATVGVFDAAGGIEAALKQRDAPPSAVTGADGFFRVDDRRPGESVNVTVQRSGYGPGGAAGVKVPRDEPLRIVLEPSSAVEGRTVDPDGKPVADAHVFLVPTDPTASAGGVRVFLSNGMKGQATGDDGLFRIEDVPPGAFEMRAEAPGRQDASLTNLEVRPGKDLRGLELVLQPGAVVEGRVLSPGGRPVAGAAVGVLEPESGAGGMIFRSSDATSDGDGFYRLDGVTPGTRNFQAEHERYRNSVRELEVSPGRNTLDFSLEGGTEVSGRVVDEGGSPVPAARVVLYEGWRSWDLPSSMSGADGSFTLAGVADGTYRISAEKEGYARQDEGQELKVGGGPVSGLEVTLTRGGAIVGQITGLEFAELSQVEVWLQSHMQRGQVSADGSYRIDNVEPGEVRVVASLQGSRQAEGKVKLEPGVPEAHLDLDFKEGLVLAGLVLRNGEPAQGMDVMLTGPGVTGRWSQADHEGRFRFEGLDEGTYELQALSRRGQGQHKQSVELTRDMEVRIDLVTVTLTGRVVDSADRSPIPGAAVTLLQPDGTDENGFFPGSSTSDSKGEFRLPDVPEGSWRVRAILSGYAPGEKQVEVDIGAPQDDLEIPLQATEGVTLEVLLPTGRPPDTVRTAVIDPAGRVVSVTSYPVAEDGRMRVSSMAPGTWDLLLDADGAAPVTVPVTAPGNAGRVILPLAGRLEIKVPALAGARIGAKARLTDANGKLYRLLAWENTADFNLDSGSRSFERVAPGAWKVDVTATDGRTWTGTATVAPGGTAQVTLE